MEQRVEPLSPELALHNEKQREWVRGHYEPASRGKYETIEGKLRLLDTILSSKWVDPSETWKLQSLGITLGDALAQALALEWVEVTDEEGNAPALRYPNTTLLVFPLTVISKRVERGEEVRVYDLFEGLRGMIRERASKS